FAKRSREPGRVRSAAQHAGGVSSRPSRSGAGSRAGCEVLPNTPEASAPVLREAEQGARAGSQALSAMVPLSLAWIAA
ncbi:hypothetical protein, partial [Paenibacillus sp. MABNR03]|uniref:hypothetical protein n=1 Tax=Paenibacillus sp. MABNR03 TaxID=3142626 RepID=UPI003D2C9AB4